jgi:hypothetical protein
MVGARTCVCGCRQVSSKAESTAELRAAREILLGAGDDSFRGPSGNVDIELRPFGAVSIDGFDVGRRLLLF